MMTCLDNPTNGPDAKHCANELRLRKHADFQRVYTATKKQHAKQMSFFAAPRVVTSEDYAGPRIGLTVGRVMGKAHQRNRMKRRLREAIRAEQAALGGLCVDVILHPRRTVEVLPYDQLLAEVRQVFTTVRKRVGPAILAAHAPGRERAGQEPVPPAIAPAAKLVG